MNAIGSRDDAPGWGERKPWFHNLRRRLMPETAVANIPAAIRDARRLRSLLRLAHELRTPLTLVDAPLQQLARMPQLGPEAEECVRIARQNCLRLIELSEGVLELIRRDHKKPLRLVPVDLDAWLRDMTAIVSHHPGLQRGTLAATFGGDRAHIHADVRAIECIFLNLFANAMKFSPECGAIRIGTCLCGSSAGFYVEDQGIGIAPEHHEVIFEPFHQLHVPNSCRHAGLGIGLALVRELTREMAGRVELRSASGAGARFTIWLPVATTKPESKSANRATAKRRSETPIDRNPVPNTPVRSKEPCLVAREPFAGDRPFAATRTSENRPTVLLVEDDPELRWLIAQALSDRFDVATANDGIEGLAQVRSQVPDVLLTDWMLPGINGLELVRSLRKQGVECKTVLITARMKESERDAALQSGIDDFLAKPFSFAELSARLGNLARAAISERELRATNERLDASNRELASVRAALIQDEKLKSIGVLAAGVLHEIQNPVSYMQAAVALLHEAADEAPERIAELVATIRDGLDRISHIVAGLRVFAFHHRDDDRRDDDYRDDGHRNDAADGTRTGGKPPTAPITPAHQIFDVTAAIDAALRVCGHELKHAQVEVHAQSCPIIGTEREITQVLINLLSNAAAATRDISGSETLAGTSTGVIAGSIAATHTAATHDGSGGKAIPSAWVRIETRNDGDRTYVAVRDNGTGITSAAMSRMFEPFFTTKKVGAGLGLGLAICNAIVRAHGGNLCAKNEVPHGARFEFDLCRVPVGSYPGPHAGPNPGPLPYSLIRKRKE